MSTLTTIAPEEVEDEPSKPDGELTPESEVVEKERTLVNTLSTVE